MTVYELKVSAITQKRKNKNGEIAEWDQHKINYLPKKLIKEFNEKEDGRLGGTFRMYFDATLQKIVLALFTDAESFADEVEAEKAILVTSVDPEPQKVVVEKTDESFYEDISEELNDDEKAILAQVYANAPEESVDDTVPTFTKEELEAMSNDDVRTLAEGSNVDVMKKKGSKKYAKKSVIINRILSKYPPKVDNEAEETNEELTADLESYDDDQYDETVFE